MSWWVVVAIWIVCLVIAWGDRWWQRRRERRFWQRVMDELRRR